MLLRRGDGAGDGLGGGLRALALHIKVYLSATHTRRCSCTTPRNFARRRRAATRPRQLLSSIVYFEGDWAQESLLQCERALYRLGVKRPPWLNASYYAERIVAKAW